MNLGFILSRTSFASSPSLYVKHRHHLEKSANFGIKASPVLDKSIGISIILHRPQGQNNLLPIFPFTKLGI
jgi:hypothetical protein